MGYRIVMHGLRLKEIMILWGMACIILFHSVADGKLVYKENLLEIDQMLKQINRPAVKSIQSEDGDIIDCVDIYKQPAFDHPAMKNHTIEMRPNYHQASQTTEKKPELYRAEETSQLWRRSGSCPNGTIPIRRIRKQDLLRATSLEEFGRKKPSFSTIPGDIHQPSGVNYSIKSRNKLNHMSVAGLFSYGSAYIGAQGDINVWNPHVASDDEYSGAYIALKNGPYYKIESVEAGWVVNPSLYGDRHTRLFAYWTADSSKKTGCFNLLCSGFVQTQGSIVLGGVLDRVSVLHGDQYKISVSISLNSATGHWWLVVGNTKVGYWPKHLFGALHQMADAVEWGGEVRSRYIEQIHPHTATQMGSGSFPGGWSTGCFIRNIRIMDNSLTLKFPSFAAPLADENNCYDVYFINDHIAEPEFYFGGPGYSKRKCP